MLYSCKTAWIKKRKRRRKRRRRSTRNIDIAVLAVKVPAVMMSEANLGMF